MNLSLTSQQKIMWHNQIITALMNLRTLEMDETAGRVRMSSGRDPRQDLIETLNEVQRTTEAKRDLSRCAAAQFGESSRRTASLWKRSLWAQQTVEVSLIPAKKAFMYLCSFFGLWLNCISQSNMRKCLCGDYFWKRLLFTIHI